MIQKLRFSNHDKEKISALAIDPALNADDFFDYTNVVIKKPWGHEYLISQNNNTAVWLLSIAHGAKTSLHCHPNKKTGLVVLAGNACVSSLNESHDIGAGQGFVIEKGAFHSTEALSPEGIVVMEVETPVNKKDLIRFSDEYGRNGKGYEGKSHHMPLENTMSHFHNEEERYHKPKKFGDCALTIARCSDASQLNNLLSQTSADIVSILAGAVYSSEKYVIGEVGDIMNAHELNAHNDLVFPEEVELLFIKKEQKTV